MKKFLFLSLLALTSLSLRAAETNLVRNPGFESIDPATKIPAGFELEGAAVPGRMGGQDEFVTQGIIFPSDSGKSGAVSQMITGLDLAKGKWITFRFRGMAQDGFAVADDKLAMKIEFFSKGNSLDAVTRLIYREITRDRLDFTINGNYAKGGAQVWRSYELEELVPFPGIDAIKISVVYKEGVAPSATNSAFYIDDFSLIQRDHSLTGHADPADKLAAAPVTVDPARLTPLGGHWYYAAQPGELNGNAISLPLTVTADNADRLYYKSDRFINPFANNMTAWLRPGYKDREGNLVTQDTFVPDSVTLIFKGDGFLTMLAKNIPNHPTAKFPDTFGTQGYNRSYIQELDKTYRLPLEPVPNPDAKVTDAHDTNHALPMGAIGVAVNGVVFYNPFDAGMQDASSIMDRCCGHPSPDNRYHYHKYPVCVNTPFTDKGEAHSQVLGFAFDGLPVYGPYESKGVMARDSTDHPLNAFNAHFDDVRGWHYHVTPGKFPYLIGGYYAKTEASNFERHPQRPPGGGGGMFPGGGPPGGGPPPGGGDFPPPPPPDF